MQFYFARKASPENLLTVQTQKGQYLQLRLSFPLCLTFSHAKSVRPLNHKILNYGIFASTLKAYDKVLGGKQKFVLQAPKRPHAAIQIYASK